MGRKLYVGNLPYTTGEQDLQDLFSTIVPRCSVYNFGPNPMTFPVTFTITGPANYSNVQNVIALPGGTGLAVSFAPWTVGPRGNYTTRCSTNLTTDTTP